MRSPYLFFRSRRFNCSALFQVIEDEGRQDIDEGNDWIGENGVDGEITSPNLCVTLILILSACHDVCFLVEDLSDAALMMQYISKQC
jgi:hypothetical protein